MKKNNTLMIILIFFALIVGMCSGAIVTKLISKDSNLKSQENNEISNSNDNKEKNESDNKKESVKKYDEDLYNDFLIDFNKLINAVNTSESKSNIEYAMKDINSDKTPELIILAGNSESNKIFSIYTQNNGSVAYVGMIDAGHSTICLKDNKQLQLNWGHQSSQKETYYIIENYSLKKVDETEVTEVKPGEDYKFSKCSKISLKKYIESK